MEAAYSSYNPNFSYDSLPADAVHPSIISGAQTISNQQLSPSGATSNLSLNSNLSGARGLSLTPDFTAATDMDQLDALSAEDLDFGTDDTVGLTPSVTQDAGMGAAIANNDGFNVHRWKSDGECIC